MTPRPSSLLSRRSLYRYRGERRKKADQRRAVIMALVKAVLSDPKLAEVVVRSELEWMEEVARAVRRRVQLGLGEGK